MRRHAFARVDRPGPPDGQVVHHIAVAGIEPDRLAGAPEVGRLRRIGVERAIADRAVHHEAAPDVLVIPGRRAGVRLGTDEAAANQREVLDRIDLEGEGLPDHQLVFAQRARQRDRVAGDGRDLVQFLVDRDQRAAVVGRIGDIEIGSDLVRINEEIHKLVVQMPWQFRRADDQPVTNGKAQGIGHHDRAGPRCGVVLQQRALQKRDRRGV